MVVVYVIVFRFMIFSGLYIDGYMKIVVVESIFCSCLMVSWFWI